MLAREQQGDVYRDAGKDRLFDRGQAFLGSRNFDEQVRPPRPRVQILGCSQSAGCVVRQQGRHFQGYPPIHTVRLVVDRSKQVGGPGDVLQCEVEKERLARFAPTQLLADRGVIRRAVFDGVVKDRRIRREPRYREFGDVALECAAVKQVACDVIKPEALTEIVKQLCCFHHVTSVSWPASHAGTSVNKVISRVWTEQNVPGRRPGGQWRSSS